MNALVRLVVSLSAFVLAGSIMMIAITKDGTPERIISQFALAVGVLAMAIAIALFRFGRQRDSLQEER